MRLAGLVLLVACGSPDGSGEYIVDVTGDGVADRVVVTDERDGFRHTFAYADIYVSQRGEAVTAKFKEGRWIWVDPAAFPGLAKLPVR